MKLLGSLPCDCGRCAPVHTRRVDVDERIELRRSAWLFGDDRTLAAAAHVIELDRFRVVSLGDGAVLHADEDQVAAVREALKGAPHDAAPIAVGAGTVNDIVKAACHDLGREYVSVATAPSMNGYTSTIAAITVDGLKRTLPSTAPAAVFAAPSVLAASPPRLARSGLADLLSKPVSTADWKLSHLLWDEPYCATPAELAGRAVDEAVAVADRLDASDGAARVELFRALILSGISMAVAGQSSPASGGEHLISHYLDMTAGGPALHGEQVGVGTRITTRLYRALLDRPASAIDWDAAAAAAPDLDAIAARLAGVAGLDARLHDQFMDQSRLKLETIGAPRERVARIRDRWESLRGALAADLEQAARYAPVLVEIGAPQTARALDAPPESLREAYRVARFSRNRYTVLDLVDDLGLGPELEDEALAGILP